MRFRDSLFKNAKELYLSLDFINKYSRLPYFARQINNLLRYGSLDMFWAVEIQTTTECNRKCSYCPMSKYDVPHGVMPEILYKKIIDDLSSWNFAGRISPHFYGEPLLDKRLPGLIQYTRMRLPVAHICILTNGDYLDELVFWRYLEAGVDSFLITLHSRALNEGLQKLLNSGNDKVKRHLQTRYPEDILLTNRAGLVSLPNSRPLRRCYSPQNKLTINHKGEVVLCCNDFFGKFVMGNLSEGSIKDIWNREKYKNVRRDTKAGIFNLAICKTCKILGSKKCQ